MKKEELEIEKIAQEYFRDSNRSQELENKLLGAIYANNDFIFRIVCNASKKYNNAISDLTQLKHDAVIKTFEAAKKNYNYEKGCFINYFSRNLKFYAEEILKEEIKNRKELIMDDVALNNSDDNIKFVGNSKPRNTPDEDTERFFVILLNSINKLFLSTEAGKENKSKVYTFFVLECLLTKEDDLFDQYINKYDFLRLLKEKLLYIREQYIRNELLLTQKEFAEITGIPEGKFSDFRLKLEDYLRKSNDLKDFKN